VPQTVLQSNIVVVLATAPAFALEAVLDIARVVVLGVVSGLERRYI
jgi:hypothetical protein